MNDKCNGNNMKLSKGGNGFITTWMPHVSINDDPRTVHSACWQVVPTSVVDVNDNTGCCFNTDTLCSAVHSVCPCHVLISSTQTHVHTQVKWKPSTQLSADSFSSFITSEHSPTSNTRSTSCCHAETTAAHCRVSIIFHMLKVLTHPQTLWIPTFCMKLVYAELCISSCFNCSLKFKQITQQRKHSCSSKQSWEIKKSEWLTVLLGENTTKMICKSY